MAEEICLPRRINTLCPLAVHARGNGHPDGFEGARLALDAGNKLIMREIKDVRIICVWHEIGEVRLCCTLRARLTFDTVYVQGAITLSYIWFYLKKPVSPGSTLEPVSPDGILSTTLKRQLRRRGRC